MITQRFAIDDCILTCAGCGASLIENTITHHDRCPEMPAGREANLIDALRRNVRHQQLVLERKNRELDALHYVWCDGGCPRGVHRWDDVLITRELVEAAERNTRRLRRWYRAVEFRLQLPGADAWQRRRFERAAAKTDLLPENGGDIAAAAERECPS